ncbi:hypothetical protein M9H77_31577 [Catharanthus roseus]|uniref:Uncharacterized protein n=1 Tax=Catharanthus roseus TaxID=4058 RepID=A0ACC0A1I5_CATRO|nr:hypothetical protein M9H77_31577 [Catharanthus roseus]
MGSNPSNGARVASRSHSPNSDTIHTSVSILSLLDNSKIVAKGQLREDWCEVEVFVALHHEGRLIHPFDYIQTIGDFVGVPIAY